MCIFKVAFIGHREVADFSAVERQIDGVVAGLIEGNEYVEFYMGRNGAFDLMAASAVRRARRELGGGNSCLILVLPYPVADIADYEEYYQEVLVPFGSDVYPKAAIKKRNEWLVDNCDMLVAYVTRKGGAAVALNRAVKAGKRFCLIDDGANPE